MKKFIIALLFLGIYCSLHGQSVQSYSYVSDKKFNGPEDFLGYNFKPHRLEIKDEKEIQIDPGSYSFGVSTNNLYVDGPEIKGIYNINNINPTKFGYQLVLMNARNPNLQGHLKIVMNSGNQVEAVIFKRTSKEREMIFKLPKLTDEQRAKEAKFYTDRHEMIIEHPDSLYGRVIMPMLITYTADGIQEKIAPRDSVFLRFEQRITIIEKPFKAAKLKKDKPAKPAKVEKPKKEKKKKEEAVEEEEASEDEGDEDIDNNSDKVVDSESEPEKIDTLIATEDFESIDDTVEIRKPKIKTIVNNFVVVHFKNKYQDGTEEDKKMEYKIAKLAMKEDAEAGMEEDRFQITVTPNSGQSFFIYLAGDKSVNSIEFTDRSYFVRGN